MASGSDTPIATSVAKPTRIFVSYRRSGTSGFVGRLTDRLAAVYGEGNVFRDVDSLRTGESFERRIGTQLSEATIVVAAIEGDWVGSRIFRRSRLQAKGDWVRKELEHALTNNIPVIPVLIGETPLPAERDLPSSLHGLLAVHTSRVRDESWSGDMPRLLQAIDAANTRSTDEDDELPFVWRSVPEAEPPPTRRLPVIIAALAVLALAVALVILRPKPPNLDDPSTWSTPSGSITRSDVSRGALGVALLELNTGTRERDGQDNAGFNVGKFTERFGLGNIPWSVAFVNWCYLQALRRVRDDPKATLPFADTPSAEALAASLRNAGWLLEPFDAAHPKPGDILFLRRGSRVGHAEIVYAVADGKVCSIGGNVRNRVEGNCRATSNPIFVAVGAVPPTAFAP